MIFFDFKYWTEGHDGRVGITSTHGSVSPGSSPASGTMKI